MSENNDGRIRYRQVMDLPIAVLGAIWLILLLIELTAGLSLELEYAALAIWLIFIIDFAIRLFSASSKVNYVRSNWMTIISLLVPALRVFRISAALRTFKLVRFAPNVRLAKILGSLYRGINILKRVAEKHAFGYVLSVSALVLILGAAGMLAFERDVRDNEGIHSYGEALWWTAMVMTTYGSAYWPKTTVGRILCVVLSVYSLGIFGYITATLASMFIGRDILNTEERPCLCKGATLGCDAVEERLDKLTRLLENTKTI